MSGFDGWAEFRLRRSASLFSALIAFVALCTGCAADYGIEFPEGRVVDSGALVRRWASGESWLSLQSGGKFAANALRLEYYSCVPGGEVQVKRGQGVWRHADVNGATTVYLEYDDGCSATMWLGDYEGRTVLWAEPEQNVVMALQ
ncbi:hypothetical protein PV703_15270 [Streptomyces sp. ME01-24h]|nr:hypothetical protein [Streptomyces sp. ME01-24h]